MDSISILSDPVRCRYPPGPPGGVIELIVQFGEYRFSVFRGDFLLFGRSASQPDEQIMVHAPALKRVGPENMVSSHNDPVFSPTSSTSESGQFSLLSSRKKRPTPLTDASLELPPSSPHVVFIAGKRKIHFKIEAVIVVLIVFVIDFAALLRRRECFPLTLVPANGQQLRANRVLWHEAVVVERLEQRDVWNPLLLQQVAEMMRVKGAERLWRDDVRQMLAGKLRSRLQPPRFDPDVDFGFSHAKGPRQRLDRKAIAANFLDLQVVPAQLAANGIRAAAKDAGGFLDRMRGELLAEGLDFFLGPAPVLVPAVQASLEHKSPTRLPGPASLPLQAANQLVEFMA